MATSRNSGAIRIIHLMLIMVLFCTFAHGELIHVDDDGQADFDNIQAGIDAAVDGDTVLVAPGEYVVTEPVTFRGKAITVKSEAGPDGTTIRMGTPADTNRGSVVVFENGETAASVLEGFTITGGTGFRFWFSEESVFDWDGGAICFVNASSGFVRNCALVQNRAKNAGGGVMVYSGSSAHLTDCIINGNSVAEDSAGGVCCASNSSVTMNNCIIAENSAPTTGGGVGCYYNSSMTIENCIITENSTSIIGGGVICWDNSLVNLSGCTIAENSAAVAGGGIYGRYNSSMTMINCTIMRNTSQDGGGVYCIGGSEGMLTNCIVAENIASWGGGIALANQGTFATFGNCTIWGNTAGEGGGGIGCFKEASMTVTNSIIGANASPSGREIFLAKSPTTSSVEYSNVAGRQAGVHVQDASNLDWGEGNIDADPLFADPNNGDFHLKSQAGRWDPNNQAWVQDEVTSPCIYAGDPNSDWSAELWPRGKRINMGAYGGTREASMSTHPEVMSLPRIAFIYGSDSEAAESFQSLLSGYGCSTTLITLDDGSATPLDSYDLVIVGDDTEDAAAWNDPQVVPAIEGSGRPIVGMGEGGYDFFGMLELSIGRPNGMHGDGGSIYAIDADGLLFSTPYPIDIPENGVMQLYTVTGHVILYLWPVPETVTVLAGSVGNPGYYPLALEHDRYVLWGFTESPLNMTQEGKRLFINVVIRASNKALGS